MDKVLDLLIDKRNYFSKQLLIISDGDVKFGLQQKLKELEKEIAQYKAEADKIVKKKDVSFALYRLGLLYKSRGE